jgi:RimJ/RimL family protein N-acetyltransferase
MHLISYSPSIGSRLATLFKGDRPVPVRLWAILDGTIQGRIVVDDPNAPTLALVRELAEGTTYIGGAANAQKLDDAVSLLRQEQEVVVCCWHNDPVISLLPPSPYYQGTAIDFTDRTPFIDLKQLAIAPPDYQLRRIDKEVVPLLEGFDYYISMFGSTERALEHTLGYCLLHDGRVASEAVAGPLTRGIAEIGVGTNESYRQKGLATITAARVIQECESQGLQPFWNASEQNAPSVALAKRLGFRTERPFRVIAWSKTP